MIRPSARWPLWILFLAIAVHLPSLRDGFVFDDHKIVEQNRAVLAETPGLLWTLPYWHDQREAGLYRPWTILSYWLDARLFGLKPAGFHATNVLLHAAVTLLGWLLLRRLFPARAALAGWVAALFAVHPIHSEAVLGIVGRAELWAALAGISACRLALGESSNARPSAIQLSGSGLCLLVAVLSKESALGLLLLPLGAVLAGRLTSTRAVAWKPVLWLWTGATALALLQRLRVMGSMFGLSGVSLMDNPLAHTGAIERTLSALGFQWVLLARLVCPIRLSADYSYRELVPSAGWSWSGALLGLLFALVFIRAVRRRDQELLFGFCWIVATGALTSNVLFPIGTVLAERLAYLPSLGALWLLGLTCARLGSRIRVGRVIARAICVALLSLLALRTITRAADWRDDLTLFHATARDAPRSGKAHANLAVALLQRGENEAALESARKSLACAPGYAAGEAAVGSALFRLGRAEEAVPHLRRATEPLSKRTLEASFELGNAYVTLGRGAAADTLFRRVARIADPSDSRPLVGLASALAVQSRWPESARAWQNAVRLAPEDRAVRRQWGYALWQAGRPDSANVIYRALASAHPTDPEVRNDLAWFLAVSERDPIEAVRSARTAFARRPDAGTADTMLEALRSAGKQAEAQVFVDSLRRAGVQWLAEVEAGWRRRFGGETKGER